MQVMRTYCEELQILLLLAKLKINVNNQLIFLMCLSIMYFLFRGIKELNYHSFFHITAKSKRSCNQML